MKGDKTTILKGILIVLIGVLSLLGYFPDIGMNIIYVCLIGLGVSYILKYFNIK